MASVAKRKWTHKGVAKEAWIVRYLDRGGRHRQKTFPLQREAASFRSKIEMEMRQGLLAPDADRLTIGKVAEEFLRHMDDRQRDGRIGETHRRRVERFVRGYILPHLANVKLSGATLTLLGDWNRDIQASNSLAPYTARNAAQVLKMIFDYAVRREMIARNPVQPLLSDLRGVRCGKIRTFTVDELKQLLLAAHAPMYQGRTPDANLRLQCAVHLAAFCGLRVGEIFGLKVANVDFASGCIHVRTSLSRHDGLKAPKSSAGNRTVAMPRHIAELLAQWVERYQRPNANGLMFAYRDGRPMNADSFRQGSWGPLLVRAGLATDYRKPTFHFHALRHFAGSWMIDSGWSLPEVARALGHSKVDMTLNVYAHALQNRAADTAQMQSLSDRLLPPPAQELRTAA